MNWYYVDAGKQVGPVDDAQLDELWRSGKVQSDTLVWREGMENWQPYSEVRPAGGGLRLATAPPVAGTSSGGVGEAVCVECGNIFPVDNMIRFGEVRVCAGCKPIFVQKLSEGAKISGGNLNYAGFWIRFAAVFVDGILLWVLNLVLGLMVGLSLTQAVGARSGTNVALQLIVVFIQMTIGISYEVIMIGKYGATLGKMACKIKVVTADGGRVSYPRALGRYFAKLVSGMLCLIGYIMAGFDEEKRALHDRICNTRVVLK